MLCPSVVVCVVVLFVVVMGLIALPIYVSKRMRGDISWLRRSSRRGRLIQEHLGAPP